MMPGLGGSALASLIAKLELPAPPTVLLWSAMDDGALADAAREAGGLSWVSKGKRASEIAAEIERLGARGRGARRRRTRRPQRRANGDYQADRE